MSEQIKNAEFHNREARKRLQPPYDVLDQTGHIDSVLNELAQAQEEIIAHLKSESVSP